MGNKLLVMLMALGVAWFSGWLFGNEFAPPRLEDLGLAMWAAMAGIGVVLSAMVAVSRG